MHVAEPHARHSVAHEQGCRVYLAASVLDPNSVLLATDLDYLKGMFAFEFLEAFRSDKLSLGQAQKQALQLGIEMQIQHGFADEVEISFFGHGDKHQIEGKLVVFEPLNLLWQ